VWSKGIATKEVNTCGDFRRGATWILGEKINYTL
jgi:hypothetical protein